MWQGFRKFTPWNKTISPGHRQNLYLYCLLSEFLIFAGLSFSFSLFFSLLFPLYLLLGNRLNHARLPYRRRDDWIYSSHGSTTVQKSYTTWIISVARVSTYVHGVGAYFSGGYMRFLSRSTRTAWISYVKSRRMHKNATRSSFVQSLRSHVEYPTVLLIFPNILVTAVNIIQISFFSHVCGWKQNLPEQRKRYPSSDYKITSYEIQKMSEIRDCLRHYIIPSFPTPFESWDYKVV